MDIRPEPELMVIGDSLAQGCRSLSVTKKFCSQSWGAKISSIANWPFIPPDHKRPVCFDAEKLIRKSGLIFDLFSAFIVIKSLQNTVRENLKGWQKDFAGEKALSSQICFDNIGIAGTKIPDLLQRTSSSSIDEIQAILKDKQLDTCSIGELANLAVSLHIPINAAFTLNPSRKQKFASLTPMDWVEKRKPKRLITSCIQS